MNRYLALTGVHVAAWAVNRIPFDAYTEPQPQNVFGQHDWSHANIAMSFDLPMLTAATPLQRLNVVLGRLRFAKTFFATRDAVQNPIAQRYVDWLWFTAFHEEASKVSAQPLRDLVRRYRAEQGDENEASLRKRLFGKGKNEDLASLEQSWNEALGVVERLLTA